MIPTDRIPVTTQEEEGSIDLRQYLALFLQWWWLIALSTLLAAAAALVISLQMTPIYQAATTLLINEAPSNKAADYNAILTSERLARTYAQMITKRPVLEEVINRLNIPLTPNELSGYVTVTTVRDTQLIVIQVENPDPNVAAAVANTLYSVFSEQVVSTQTARFAASKESIQKEIGQAEQQITNIRMDLNNAFDSGEVERLETRLNQYEKNYANLVLRYEEVRLAEAQTLANVIQVELAGVPSSPIKPNVLTNTLLAAVVGMMLAVGGIFAYDALDDTIKNPEEITHRFNLPILGVITQYDEPEEGGLITRAEPRAPVSEAFRALRTNVQYASVDRPLRTMLVTSPAPADGKSTVSANLAVVLAQSGRRVSVIDADLHRPRVHMLFGAETHPGLSALFVQPRVYLNGTLQFTAQENLRLVSSGEIPPNPSELLGSKKMREILNAVLDQSDMVILDTPPILSVTDAAVLSPQVDGVLLVLKSGSTRMSQLRAAVEHLQRVNANIIGVVLNRVDTQHSRYGYYYKSYYYDRYEQRPSAKQPGIPQTRRQPHPHAQRTAIKQ